MNLSKRIISGIIAVLLLIAMLPTAVFAEPLMAASNVGGTSKGVDAMIAIESALSSKKIGKTTTVANDGYIGIPLEVSVYHGGGTVKSGYAIDATPVVIYVVNTQVKRIGTDSDVDIINSMLDKGYIVVIFDYLNNVKATSPDIDWSVQGLRPKVVNRTFFSGTSLPSGSYHNNMVVPAGYNIEFNHVFFEIDKHGADGIFDKTIEIWNNDFRSYHRKKLVKWVDENGNRKAVQNGFDGSAPVWLDANGNVSASGEYVRVNHTKAERVEDLVKPDGTPVDWNLYMHVTYPTNPGYDVPVMALACSASHLAGGTQTADRPQLSGFAFNGYATVTFDHGFFPMARTDHFDFYSGTVSATGNTGVTNDGGAYCLQHYDNVRIDTAAMRYIRYLSASNHAKYSFNSTSVGVYGNSKGGWTTHLGEENPETGIQRRIVPGYNGKSRYENGKTTDIYVGDYVIDGGEEQPWLTYNGEKIDSGADLVYAGCSGGQYTITSAHAPTFISCQLTDGSFYGNSNLMVNACKTADVPSLWFEVAQGHTLASIPDMRYGVNTYNAFFDFCNYYLRGDAVKVLYVHRDAERHSGMPSNAPITVKFTGPVSKSEVEKITLVSSDGKTVTGKWSALFGNTEWTLEAPTLDCDTVYTLTVPAGLEGKNGKAMTSPFTYEFRTGYEKADTGSVISNAMGTFVYFTAPNPEDIDAFEAELYKVRLYVSNDAVNSLEVYPLGMFDKNSPESAIVGSLLTTVPVYGAGQYDVDVSDFVKNAAPGATVAFLIKQAKLKGETLVHSSPLATNKGDCTLSSSFKTSFAEAPDGTPALRLDSMSHATSYPNNEYYYSPSTILTNSHIIKDGVLREEDIGRTFRISLKVYDTTSRIITVRMESLTSSARKFTDYDVSYYNIHTKANEWVEFSFLHTVYEPLYADTVGYKTQKLTVSAPSRGSEAPGLYIKDITSTEIVTDVTVSGAELLTSTTKQRENPLATEYGIIPDVYESVEDYPYILFDGKGECVGAGSSLIDSGVGLLLGLQDNTPPLTESNHVLLVRRDMEHSLSAYSNFGFIQGKLTIDLLGNTFTCTQRLFHAQAKRSGTMNLTVKNGTLLQTKNSIVDVSSYNTEHYTYETTGTRCFNFFFENVTFGYTEGASATPFITTSGSSQYPVKSNVKLTNCTIDLITNAPGGTYSLFSAHNSANANSSVSIELIGGSILANSFSGITVGKTQGNGSFKFASDDAGRYTTVTLPETAAAPVGSYDTDVKVTTFIESYTEGGKTVYRLDLDCTHGGDEPWQLENGVHWRVCSYCRTEVDRGECSGGKANCASGAICSSCGNVYTEPDPNSHVSDGKWTYREDKHYSTCKNPGCGATIEEECSGGVATCKYRAICSTCKSNYGETLPHTYDSDCDTSCNVCRTNREAPHIATDEWKTNGESHWKECSCGEIFSTGAHIDENADGKCDTCSYELTASNITPPPSPTPEGMSVGAIVGIAVGSTATVGIGAFALIWFAIKKKSFADLLALFAKK